LKREIDILVVDDDEDMAETLVDILQNKGYRLTQVGSGEDAKRVIKEEDFDLVFVDVKMPVMNSLETYLDLRKIRPHIKVIMITAYRQEVETIVEEAIKTSLYTCLYKPIDVDNLLKIIEKVVATKTGIESQQIRIN